MLGQHFDMTKLFIISSFCYHRHNFKSNTENFMFVHWYQAFLTFSITFTSAHFFITFWFVFTAFSLIGNFPCYHLTIYSFLYSQKLLFPTNLLLLQFFLFTCKKVLPVVSCLLFCSLFSLFHPVRLRVRIRSFFCNSVFGFFMLLTIKVTVQNL